MKKDDRKFDILYSIIRDYIKTAEPVGSRTIEKKYNIGISSATIRNEMADLEEMGYLLQPHTSSGRIPSDKAYRLYVDRFMKRVDVDNYIRDDVRSLYNRYFGELEEIMNKTAQILTKLTNLTSLVSTPNITGLNIRDLRLIHIEDERVLLVVITKQGIVKNGEMRLNGIPTEQMLEHVANFLNLCLTDMQTEFSAATFAASIDALSPWEQKILAQVVEAIKTLFNQEEDIRFISNGVTEIFRYPEFRNDMDKTKRFLEAIHRNDLLSYLFTAMDDEPVRVRIGEENEVEQFSDCSVISATYKLNGRPVGTIGVVGPTRMDYDYCVSVIETLTDELTEHLTESIGGKED
ncbi:MAG: heat-inducible transcription repressor HrcA [Eubacteriaceae bacterium]|nr:heat-inducible transcription repressor HrcA [Eubacteriaceae bacterium]